MQTAIGMRDALTVFGDDYDTPDGYCIRDYIHVVDLADAHVLTLKYGMKKDHNPLILNVGTGKGHSVLEVIETFKRAASKIFLAFIFFPFFVKAPKNLT